jgi:acetolactate synthase-1/2/3 large subunit
MQSGHNQRRTGAEVLADMLAGYGVTHVFMVPAVLRRTFAEMERRTKIARVHCHGEKSAAYMADGYARASGKPGICMAQVIGALNLAAGLRDAYLAHSPVIAMTGGRDPKTKFRKVYQEIDDVPAFEPVTKMNVTIDDVARIPDMVRQAFRAATTGAPGPVHLQFRGNEGQVDLEEAEMEALVEVQFARVPPFRPEPEAAHVKAALELLQKAARPIIVAGGGARASGAGRELVALAEALQIPIATSLNGKDIIPGIHPLSVGVVGSYSRECANRTVNRADLVCFIGTETGGMTTHFWVVPKIGMPAIQIDIEPQSLGRNYPLVASVLGDARSVLVRMLGQIDKSSAAKRAPWIKELSDLRADWYTRHKPMLESDAVPIHPARICGELTKHVPDDAIVGWVACTTCARRHKATCEAPVISAGHFRRVLEPRPRARIGQSSFLPETLVSGTTSPRWKRPSAGISPPSLSSTTTAAATSPSEALIAPTAANRPPKLVNCGPITR